MGLIVRGNVPFSDVNRNIRKLKDACNMVSWNQEGFKYGICNHPPIGQPYSMLCLANNSCVRENFSEMVDKFSKLYKRKVEDTFNSLIKVLCSSLYSIHGPVWLRRGSGVHSSPDRSI
jgi:hypothetical protein